MRLKLDNRGRLTIPKIIKETLKLKNDSVVNIEFDENKIIITKPDEVDYKAIIKEALEMIKKMTEKELNDITYKGEYHLICGSDFGEGAFIIEDILNKGLK